MRRHFEPTFWTFLIAVLFSLSVHLPVWEGLGVLARKFHLDRLLASLERPPRPAEVELVLGPLPEPTAPVLEPEEEQPANVEEGEDEDRPVRRRRRRRRREPPPEPEAREVQVVEAPPRAQSVIPDQPQPEEQERTSVEQVPTNPDVEPPPDARFQAEQSNRVEQETLARVRNLVEQSRSPQAGAELEPSPSPEEGNADDRLSRDVRDMEGSTSRRATPEEGVMDRPRRTSSAPLPDEIARGAASRREGERPDPEQARAGARARDAQGGDTVPETLTVNDGEGAFVVRVPNEEGAGGGAGGGERQDARRARAGSGSRRRGGPSEGGAGRGQGEVGPDLRVSWRQFEEVVGEETLREERERFVEERTSRVRGGRHRQSWARFQAALENYEYNVAPGNQTALNAAADPFATFEARVHRRIHPNFVEGFLRGLPAGASSPFNDMTLKTKLEIVFNRDGTLAELNFVSRSGFTPFDFGAWNAVMRGQPYPAPPEAILSGDGRVYIHWAFYRNHRQCGTFNAQPYILPGGGGGGGRGPGPGQVDPGPSDALPPPAPPRPGAPEPGESNPDEESPEREPPEQEQRQDEERDRPRRRRRLRYPGGVVAT
ncbi:MAG: TonB C-terminal domain-containing protein [Myxococcota bacterium]